MLRGFLSVTLALLVLSTADAQSARPGMRLTVTRVAPMGGFTASGLLVVHTTAVTRTPAPECGVGAIRFDAEGHDARGRIRRAHVVSFARSDEATVEIGAGPCAARVEVTLDAPSSRRLTLCRATQREPHRSDKR